MFARKMQAILGEPVQDLTVNADCRGGEPQDQHWTLKMPGAAHGMEQDPIEDEHFDQVHAECLLFNKASIGAFPDSPVKVVMRIMDSDGHP